VTCDAPSPGGNLRCIREPHDDEGHVWRHHTAGAPNEVIHMPFEDAVEKAVEK